MLQGIILRDEVLLLLAYINPQDGAYDHHREDDADHAQWVSNRITHRYGGVGRTQDVCVSLLSST